MVTRRHFGSAATDLVGSDTTRWLDGACREKSYSRVKKSCRAFDDGVRREASSIERMRVTDQLFEIIFSLPPVQQEN